VRIRRTFALAATAALLVACGTADDDPAAEGPDGPDGQEAPADPDALDDPTAEDLDLEDPNEQVADGEYRGEGIILPVPDGWQLDTFAFAQGLVLAMPDDANEQFAGQAVDTADLPEEISFDDLVEANRDQFETGPSEDEAIELAGAEQAHMMRFDDLPAQQEGEADGTLLLVMADDGDGRIAVFNYAAPSDVYDEARAEELLASAGFDPDSEPSPPAAPAPMG
jgi:hypothetical protein